MEKLIELLNEYEKENKTELGTNGYEWCLYRDKLALRNGGVFQIGTFHKIYLISKEYGFIKWLVENDKIDREKMGRFKPYRAYKDAMYGCNTVEFEDGDIIPSVNGQLYDSILCGLAISDNPIELLTRIIK